MLPQHLAQCRQPEQERPVQATVKDRVFQAGTRSQAFLATKVWTHGRKEGIAQMEESMKRLRTDRIDLMQIHNLVD